METLSQAIPALRSASHQELIDLMKKLDAALVERNTLTLDEFLKYRPLFVKDSHKHMPETRYMKIVKDYQRRVSMYHEVRIVRHTASGDILLFTLPPIFNQVETFNTIGKRGADVVSIFHNALNRDNPIIGNTEQVASMVIQNIKKLGDETKLSKKIEEAERIEQQTVAMFKKENPTNHTNTDDWF